MRWILLALACAGCAAAPTTDNFGQPFPKWVPRDVRHFIIKAQACDHFSGEHPFDEQRRKFLETRIAETCTGLDERRDELNRRYVQSSEISQLIAEWDE